MKKKLTFTMELKPRNIFQRACRSLVHFIIDNGLCGETRFPGQFIEQYAGGESFPSNKLISYSVLNTVIKNHKRDIQKHFQSEDYPLDLEYIRGDIIRDFLGFNVDDYITARLVKGLKIDEVYRLDGPRLVKRS